MAGGCRGCPRYKNDPHRSMIANSPVSGSSVALLSIVKSSSSFSTSGGPDGTKNGPCGFMNTVTAVLNR